MLAEREQKELYWQLNIATIVARRRDGRLPGSIVD
jgi:hypothetical protein